MSIIGTLPNNIQNGQTVDATPVMADFNFIVNQVNANANPTGTLTAPSGTRAMFHQASAPPGWAQDATLNDFTIQLTGGTSGGAISNTGIGYSTMFNAQWVTDGHALTIAELAVHNHTAVDTGHTHAITDPQHAHGGGNGGSFINLGAGSDIGAGGTAATSVPITATSPTGISINTGNANITVANAGSGNAHSHTKTFNVNYIQCIICQKT